MIGNSEETASFMIENNNANVAGRDINIIQQEPKTLWDLSTKELQDELARCVYKRSEINKKFILPLLLIFLSIGSLFIGLNFKNIVGTDFIFLILVFGIAFPAIWFANIEKEAKTSLNFYKERITYIKLILQDRK